MRDIDEVIALLDDAITELAIVHRAGHDMTHTRVGNMQRYLTQARDILEAWPAKVYAIGVPPVEQGRE